LLIEQNWGTEVKNVSPFHILYYIYLHQKMPIREFIH